MDKFPDPIESLLYHIDIKEIAEQLGRMGMSFSQDDGQYRSNNISVKLCCPIVVGIYSEEPTQDMLETLAGILPPFCYSVIIDYPNYTNQYLITTSFIVRYYLKPLEVNLRDMSKFQRYLLKRDIEFIYVDDIGVISVRGKEVFSLHGGKITVCQELFNFIPEFESEHRLYRHYDLKFYQLIELLYRRLGLASKSAR